MNEATPKPGFPVTLFARLYEYRVDAPGRPEHGRVIRFDGRTCPAMHQREPYTLADGTMAHIDYIGPVQS